MHPNPHIPNDGDVSLHRDPTAAAEYAAEAALYSGKLRLREYERLDNERQKDPNFVPSPEQFPYYHRDQEAAVKAKGDAQQAADEATTDKFRKYFIPIFYTAAAVSACAWGAVKIWPPHPSHDKPSTSHSQHQPERPAHKAIKPDTPKNKL